MQDNPKLQVLGAHCVNVVLDIAQGSCLGLGIIVVHVINDFLFAIASGESRLCKTQRQRGAQ